MVFLFSRFLLIGASPYATGTAIYNHPACHRNDNKSYSSYKEKNSYTYGDPKQYFNSHTIGAFYKSYYHRNQRCNI